MVSFLSRIGVCCFTAAVLLSSMNLSASANRSSEETNRQIEPEQLGEYLYEMTLEDYIRQTEPAFLVNSETQPMEMKVSGGCTSIRNGNLYGRNLDLSYSEIPEFIIHLEKTEDHFQSIGVCANPYLTNQVEELSQEELLALPNITNDGINENGVVASVNVVIPGDLDDQSGTAPGKETLWGPYVVRYILDHAESAEHALQLLQDVNITGGFENYSLHWMIADASDTFIVEILHGQLVVSRNEYPVMTNFYMNLGPMEEEQMAAGSSFRDLPKLNEFAIGVERFCLARDLFEQSADAEGMADLLERVRATEMYHTDSHDPWYTECTYEELPISSSREEFEEAFQQQLECYEHRDRKDPKGDWITWHTSIYNLEVKTLSLYSQEEYQQIYHFCLEEVE